MKLLPSLLWASEQSQRPCRAQWRQCRSPRGNKFDELLELLQTQQSKHICSSISSQSGDGAQPRLPIRPRREFGWFQRDDQTGWGSCASLMLPRPPCRCCRWRSSSCWPRSRGRWCQSLWQSSPWSWRFWWSETEKVNGWDSPNFTVTVFC